MKKQQEKQTPSNCIEHAMSRMPEGTHGMATHDQRQFDDLARMRIERDRAPGMRAAHPCEGFTTQMKLRKWPTGLLFG